ncbi:proprotein convertase P-domain-containing protein [Spartinivicinus ruber]|uniref:proprotein convertase P-domain-containing protein n=1 Tax=Spartinivicinus ruber TaxID=2683272 RepID=UPI0013D668CB|nr:proprotein convertase P-domain-containing protein [Spartinivicinus ruber]
MNYYLSPCVLGLSILAQSVSASLTHHSDFRKTIKLDLQPSVSLELSGNNEQRALQFLEQSKSKYGLNAIFESLRLTKVKTSLLAKHFYFQQYLHDIEVDGAEIIVSIDTNNRNVIRVYNNTYPASANFSVSEHAKRSKRSIGLGIIDEQTASELCWDYLQSDGKLLARPQAKLVYINKNSEFIKAFKVNISIGTPHGSWEFYVNALSGEIIKAYRVDLPYFKNANDEGDDEKWTRFPVNKNHKSLDTALEELDSSTDNENVQNDRRALAETTTVDGMGLVFDPNPKVTLQNDTLEDTSPAESFEGAYVSKILKDITFKNGVYYLTGPWVTIEDFDKPNTLPSTTADGNWFAKRGNNAFNDAMTYYHIDQNQRYIQSLGFTGSRGIQYRSIPVDTDGIRGRNQSRYLPDIRKLSFGHGCIDDNEDSDVILHEYGHALTYAINPKFKGGDTGAIGEGFSDYWAASYRYTTPNGLTFHPERAISWDWHPDCRKAGPERRFDRLNFRYDPSRKYRAHRYVNGVNGDDLWSTPLVQSHLELLKLGVNRSEIDTVILEAQYGFAEGVTMPEMAASIVNSAENLYPNGPHARVFTKYFSRMNILQPTIDVVESSVSDQNGKNYIQPGKSINVTIPLKNTTNQEISNITAELLATEPSINIEEPVTNYPNLNPHSTQFNQQPYVLALSNEHACGDDIPLKLKVNYFEGDLRKSYVDYFTLPVGERGVVYKTSENAVAFPQATGSKLYDPVSITDQITISDARPNSKISVGINLNYDNIKDISITLTSPSGTTVVLKEKTHSEIIEIESGAYAKEFFGTYPEDLTPAESLSAFEGENHNGTWTLVVTADRSYTNPGVLNSWSISSVSEATCEDL